MTSIDHLLNFYQERINALEKENARLNVIIEAKYTKVEQWKKQEDYLNIWVNDSIELLPVNEILKQLISDPIFEQPLKETDYGKVS